MLPWQPPHLGHIEHQQANSAGKDDHGHGQSVRGVNEVLFGKDETERSTDTNDDDNKVGGNADKAGVVDEEVLDVAALVGQEEAKHDQQPLVHVQGPHKVREILAVALFVTQNGVFVGDLWREGGATTACHMMQGQNCNTTSYKMWYMVEQYIRLLSQYTI